MTDVRLTATNPDDSSVVPVACNAKGELKLEEPTFDANAYVKVAGDNMTGDLTLGTGNTQGTGNITLGVDGSATFAKKIGSEDFFNGDGYLLDNQGSIYVVGDSQPSASEAFGVYRNGYEISNALISLKYNGSAVFTGDVVVGSRNSKWMIVESGGLAHLIEQSSFKGQLRNNEYPELRNIPNELTMVEQALGDVMEKLRMVPPAGWPVWDGSDENS